jgi:hypothetical protein
MTDPLEQLKQQLYTKIQATCKPEETPTDIERLKYSQLPEYQAHQELKQQTQQQWRQKPMQGAIIKQSPCTPAYFHSLLEDLTLAQSHLEAANSFNCLLQDNTPELASNIADALTACQEALAILNDLPTYRDSPHEN